ncbi:hypothetical protein ABW19_dt0208754 [Dactylella cylindrospora]|nr:hypothetical protein ABW19_dt0208754 [Dactylella cylindrospora]
MERIRHDGKLNYTPRPCEYFDLIGGTSTGGLIAIMLGRLGMTVQDAIDAYDSLAQLVFHEKKLRGQDGAFKASNLEKAIKSIVGKFDHDEEALMIDDKSRIKGCKTFVCAQPAQQLGNPRLFRTYASRDGYSQNCKIWEATRATSAAPLFFKRILIGTGSLKEEFLDAGLGCNNPTKVVLEEAENIWGSTGHIACIISLGTGRPDTISIPRGGFFQNLLIPIDVLKGLKGISTDCEMVAEELEKRFKDQENFYFRFSVDRGLEDVRLNEWEKMSKVVTHAIEYSRNHTVNTKLDNAVKVLVEPTAPVWNAHESAETVQSTSPNNQTLNCETAIAGYCPPPSGIFTGRTDILDQMREYFQIKDPTPPGLSRRIVVLYGPGGVGKTQLTLKFLQKCSDRFSNTMFVDAASEETLDFGLTNLSKRYTPAEPNKESILRWFITQKSNWLLIIDNADTDLNLRQYIPRCDHGNILITTRNQHCKIYAPGTSIGIGGLLREDAISLLLKAVGEDMNDGNAELRKEADTLCDELGDLPLAIVQAGSYIQINCTVAQYTAYLADRRADLMSSPNKQSYDYYNFTAYQTWDLSYRRLKPESRQLLQICSTFHFRDILQRIFSSGIGMIGYWYNQLGPTVRQAFVEEFKHSPKQRRKLAKLRESAEIAWTADGKWDGRKFNSVVEELTSYSLVSVDRYTKVFFFHPLIHKWAGDIAAQEEEEALYYNSLGFELLCSSLERITAESGDQMGLGEYIYRQQLIPHIEKVLRSDHIFDISPWPLLDFFTSLGLFDEGAKWGEIFLLIYTRAVGREHWETLVLTDYLGEAFRRLGKLDSAEALLLQSSQGLLKEYGESSAQYVYSAINLCSVYSEQGKLELARDTIRKLRAAAEKSLGPLHYLTKLVKSEYGLVLRDLEEFQLAEEIYSRLFETSRGKLGDRHPDTMADLHNLCLVWWDLGMKEKALATMKQVASLRRELLRPDHPDIILSERAIKEWTEELSESQDS